MGLLPPKLDTKRDGILHQMHHFSTVRQVYPEVTLSPPNTSLQRCIRILLEVDPMRCAFIYECRFNFVFEL